MKKSDIKNGMHVITNDGCEYIIISGVETTRQTIMANTVMAELNGSGWMSFDKYDDDLHYHKDDDDDDDDDESYDIYAVYVPQYYAYTLASARASDASNETFRFSKLWERPKKMTKAEIEKELGYEIEIVED